MCQFCNAENKAILPDDFFSEQEIKTFIDLVFNGVVTVHALDETQYLKMSRKMSESIVVGFGSPLEQLEPGSEAYELLQDLITDGYRFNAAKQYQCVREMSAIEADSAQAYYDKANGIFYRYNIDYFNTELDSAEWQARAAFNWLDFVKWDGE